MKTTERPYEHICLTSHGERMDLLPYKTLAEAKAAAPLLVEASSTYIFHVIVCDGLIMYFPSHRTNADLAAGWTYRPLTDLVESLQKNPRTVLEYFIS